MHHPVSGEAIILSEDDADEIAQAVANLTKIIWDTLARRRILLRPPVGRRPARLKPPRPPKTAPLDELF
jgi:hypothetical protein